MLQAFEAQVGQLAIIPSDGGRFEVEVDGKLLYSKLATKRHAEPGEIPDLIRQHLGKN